MGKYTIIADIGKTLVNLFRDTMVPQPIKKPEQIGVCSPKERGSFSLGIHQYDIVQENGLRNDPIHLPDGSLQNPPVNYELFYIISVSSKAEASTKAIDEQRIFGRLLQVINDNQVIPQKYMPEVLRMSDEEISINMLSLELDQKIKIWSMFSEPYRLSAFFSVKPISIESTVIKKPKHRVSSINVFSQIKK